MITNLPLTGPIYLYLPVLKSSLLKRYAATKEKNLSDDELSALNNLIKNHEIVIQKADKGNTVVICDKNAYIQRMKELIRRKSLYTVCIML